MFSSLLSLALTLLPLVSATPLIPRQSLCNGHASLCSKSYGNMTFIGAHNSYGNGSSLMDNQGKGVVDQLNDGIRTLQVQAHNTNSGEIHLCHTSCTLLDGGSLTSYLEEVGGWMVDNPTEVLTLIIVNIDTLPPTQYASSFSAVTSTNMTDLVYIPTSAVTSVGDWPTLGEMVGAGKRLVVFMDYGADYGSVGWIIDEFSNMWEDAYDVTDQSFSCNVNRTSGSPSSTMYMTNHFLDITGNFFGVNAFLPDKDRLNETNAESGLGSIGEGVETCVGLWSRPPNHILLDFYDSNGNAPFNVAAQLNGVPAPTNIVTASSISLGTNAAASSAASASLSATATASGGSRPMTTGGTGAGMKLRVGWAVEGWVGAVVLGVVGGALL